jgi:hypothetical protein
MRRLPPPAVYSVPEPQPPASCMPMPNRNAPAATDMPSGAQAPPTSRPKATPVDSTGANSSTVNASSSNCACTPRMSRSVNMRR